MRLPGLCRCCCVLALVGCTAGGASPAPPLDAGPPVVPASDAATDSAVPPPATGCYSDLEEDADGDGFTRLDGDCHDCSPQVNPAAFDDPSNQVDEDCDGTAAQERVTCDGDVALDAVDPFAAARTIGLCRTTTEGDRRWGVISAEWVQADGRGRPFTSMQHGMMSRLGTFTPRAGARMLAISSGAARAPDQPGFTSQCDTYVFEESSWPAGFDPDSAACPDVTSGPVYDAIALQLRIRVPSNAQGFEFDSSFFTYEYPGYICSEYNDFFLVVMDPAPAGAPPDKNLVFDQDGNRVGVNTSLLRVCEPGLHPCPLGTGPLAGTGYDPDDNECGGIGSGGSTGWLHTQVPVEAGSIITLRFATWDAGDPTLDSLALIDNFRWLVEDPGDITTDPILF